MPGTKGSSQDQITNLNRALQLNEDSKTDAKKLYDKHQKYYKFEANRFH